MPSVAGWMKLQVLTTMTSASSGESKGTVGAADLPDHDLRVDSVLRTAEADKVYAFRHKLAYVHRCSDPSVGYGKVELCASMGVLVLTMLKVVSTSLPKASIITTSSTRKDFFISLSLRLWKPASVFGLSPSKMVLGRPCCPALHIEELTESVQVIEELRHA